MSRVLGTVEANYEEVHTLSVDLLTLFQDNEVPPTLAFAAMVMTLGRMASEDELQPEQTAEFIKTVTEWITLYFYQGEAQ